MKRIRLCGYQPQYFPRLHYMNRLLSSEIFEISDYVQFVKKHAFEMKDGTRKRGRSFQAHAVIKNVNGPFFLTVPTRGEMLPINKTEIDYSKDWIREHLKSIEVSYRKSSNYEKFYPEIEALLTKKYASISDLSVATTMWAITRLITHEPLKLDGFTIENVQKLLEKKHPYRLQRIFLASESTVPPPVKGEANAWCIALCKYAGANEYIYGGTSHKAYMDLSKFSESNIKTVLQDWKCQVYQQMYMHSGFITNLSVIDLVMNTNVEQAAKIIHGENAFPNFHPAKIVAYGAATYFESESVLNILDLLKLF